MSAMVRTLGEDVAEEINIQIRLRREDDTPCRTLLIGRAYLEAYLAMFGLPADARLTHAYGLEVVEVGWPEFLQVTE